MNDLSQTVSDIKSGATLTYNLSALTDSVITYGDVSLRIGDLPNVSVLALAQSGLTHKLGNEVASQVSTAKLKAARAELPEGSAESDIKARAKTIFSIEEVNALLAEYRAEMLSDIRNGTMGTRSAREPGKPKLTPLEAAIEEIAFGEIAVRLASTKGLDGKPLKLPTGNKTITFASGQTRTRAEMFANLMASSKDGVRAADRITKAAEKLLRDRERLAKAFSEDDATADL